MAENGKHMPGDHQVLVSWNNKDPKTSQRHIDIFRIGRELPVKGILPKNFPSVRYTREDEYRIP
ncbi:MAG: hypothetical protein WBD74_08380 [Candidatus Aquilonibacter sp.]